MGIFGKTSHIPSQRKGLVGFLQDVIHVSSLHSGGKSEKSEDSAPSGSAVSETNQKKLRLVDHYDNLAGDALARGDKKQWEEHSKRAQEIDDSVK